MLRFNLGYFLLTILLTVVEIYIGARMHDAIIRPYGGDFLCVIFLYCMIRSFLSFRVWPTALAVLVFAYMVETLQYFHWADRLGFRKPSLMRTLMGVEFTWIDILCYTLGIGLVLGIEVLVKRKHVRLAGAAK
jgi:Protein of unknown function (DUF2809)